MSQGNTAAIVPMNTSPALHIGLDISVLRIAQAGVLTYARSVLEQMLAQHTPHRWTLLDVLPLNPQRSPLQLDLNSLDAAHVRVVRCPGLQRRYLSQHPRARSGRAHQLARRLDQALDTPWGKAATAALGLELRAALAGTHIFHSSDQFLYAPPGAAALLTIYDMTTLVHPEWHARDNTTMHTAKDRFAMERAHHIIAISEATKRDVMEHLHIPKQRISVVYGAADERFRPAPPDEVAPVLARYGLRGGEYILSIGTLEPRKNYVRLIEAYAALHAAADTPPPPLVIAGGHGWLYEEILAAPERLGLAEQIRFLGKVPAADLPLLLAGAGIFVYPSLYEGFGLPVLEALACGVPVVASHTTSIPEVLGDAGLYCDPRDPASITRALADVLATPELAAWLRAAGPKRATRFSWQRAARETLAVYEHLYAS
jgi:glycosyltransferase involved in cell wall biosynthesis